MFTCITDTSALVWRETFTSKQEFFDTLSEVNDSRKLGELFTVLLLNVNGANFTSVATFNGSRLPNGMATVASISLFCADNALGEKEQEAVLKLEGILHDYTDTM